MKSNPYQSPATTCSTGNPADSGRVMLSHRIFSHLAMVLFGTSIVSGVYALFRALIITLGERPLYPWYVELIPLFALVLCIAAAVVFVNVIVFLFNRARCPRDP